MVEDIIAILEYLMNNPVLRAAGIAYIIFSAIVLILIVAVFVIVLKQIAENHKRHGRK